jgi:cold shock CspA family protein
MAMIRAITIAAFLALALSAIAQEPAVQVEGRVAWIAGQGMVIAPDGNPSVNVDISQVPQDQRAALREGDRVVVTGTVNNERTRVIAASIQRVGPLSSR